MNTDWFTITNINANTIAISEYGHWEETHCYLLLGSEKALLIDTGTGIAPLKPVIKSLTGLPVLTLCTHCHWDHIGGFAEFNTRAVHEADAGWLRNGLPLPLPLIRQQVLKEPLRQTPPAGFDIETYQVYQGEPEMILKDKDRIDLGARVIDIIHTPGHAPGHICLYEDNSGFLFTGDLLYEGTIYANYPSTDPAALVESLRKIGELNGVKRLLPGHNRLDISRSLLAEALVLSSRLETENLVYQGSGLHQNGSVSFLF